MFSSWRRLRRAARRFKRASEGSAAVEFGLVAVPFFMLIFGMAEVAMLGLGQTSLNYAVAEAGREIRTGEAQRDGVMETEFVQMVCDNLNSFILMSCQDTLFVDVDRFDSFVDLDEQDDPMANGDLDDSNFGFDPGVASDIVVVRAYYRWHLLTPMFEQLLGNVSGGERILISTMMFRNEPFQ